MISTSNNEVVITDLAISTPKVVRYFEQHPEDDAARRSVEMGVEVLSLTQTTLDMQAVEEAVKSMLAQLSEGTDHAGKKLLEEMGKFLAQQFQPALEFERKQLAETLARVFDPTSDKSVQQQLERRFTEALAQNNHQISLRLTSVLTEVNDPTNPLAQLKSDLTKQVKQVQDQVVQLGERVAAAIVAQKERQRQTMKGAAFEEAVLARLQDFAAGTHDVVEPVGFNTRSSKKGDILVTLAHEDTGGELVRLIFEAKDHSGTFSFGAIRAELDGAMANRGATFGVFVASSPDSLPGQRAIFEPGGHMLATYIDIDSGFDAGLALAYRWARFEALAAMAHREQHANVAAVRAALKDARRCVERLGDAKTGVTKAMNQMLGVNKSLDEIEIELNRHLAIIDAAISGDEGLELAAA